MKRVALLLLAAVLGSALRAEIKVGDPFPALTRVPGIAMLGGGTLPPTDRSVLLVDFWASWCAPCKASFPALARLHTDYSRKGLIIAGVSVDEKMAAAMQFVRSQRPPFVTLHDREQNLVTSVVVPAMPTTYLIGKDGRVRFIHSGYHGSETDRQLREQIELLIAEKAP